MQILFQHFFLAFFQKVYFACIENEAHGDDICLLIDILMINGWIDEPPMN